MIEWLQRSATDPELIVDDRTLPIAIRRHPRARRMTLRLAPDGSEIRLTIPNWGRTRDAVEFAESRKDWLAGQLAKLPETVDLGNGTNIRFRGQAIQIYWAKRHPRSPRLENAVLALGGPEDRIAARVQRWLEGQAIELLRADLEQYCASAELDVPSLALSRARRRWGSCSTGGTVRINWRLVQAPDFVRQSVVAHEVAHLVHFDHSPAFYALLGRIYGDRLAEADRWLKANGRELYAAFP